MEKHSQSLADWAGALTYVVIEVLFYAALVYVAYLWPEGFFTAPLGSWSLSSMVMAISSAGLLFIVGWIVCTRANEIWGVLKKPSR